MSIWLFEAFLFFGDCKAYEYADRTFPTAYHSSHQIFSPLPNFFRKRVGPPIPRPGNGISLSVVYPISHNPVLHTVFAKLDPPQTPTLFTLTLTAVFISDLTWF